MDAAKRWPELSYEKNRDTYQTLHRWTQIVGKIKPSKTLWVNHSWHAALYVTERGLSTSLIHLEKASFSIEFDFLDHMLTMKSSDGKEGSFRLISLPVCSFYEESMDALSQIGVSCVIFDQPNELADELPFSKDAVHHTYSPECAADLGRWDRGALEESNYLRELQSN